MPHKLGLAALKKIVARAKAIQRQKPNTAWKQAIRIASAAYRAGRLN